jgi:hypothetical protein
LFVIRFWMLPKSLKKLSCAVDVFRAAFLSVKHLISSFVSHRMINDYETVPQAKLERDFRKVVRKLENKMWLEPEIYPQLNGTQADALKNFRTTENRLSLFIADDENAISRILAAIVAGGQNATNADYAIFETEILDQCGINYERCPGETADEQVNKLHIDLKC